VYKFARTVGLGMILAALAYPAQSQIFPHKKKAQKPSPTATTDSLAPDKELYEKALDGIKHGHYEVARLQLNTLLNTYPDSDYLAKAKLAIADSYFKEGGTGNLNLAVDEYKSFITFFPYMDEAAYAQMQIAMTHYRRMGKADRDRTEAELAEQEFQIFLQKYPSSPLFAQSQQRLRDVQEDLADGDFKIASFYATKKDNRAAASRLTDVVDRYPLYSKADQALWMLANIWQKAPIQTKQEEQLAVVRKELAATLYTRIVRDYPLSPYAGQAKQRLKDLGAPIPQPDATALARMQQEQNRPHPRATPATLVGSMIHSGPDVSRAAHAGLPNMNPPDSNGGETLQVAVGGMNIAANGGVSGGTITSDASKPAEAGAGSGEGASNPPAQPPVSTVAGAAAVGATVNAPATSAPTQPNSALPAVGTPPQPTPTAGTDGSAAQPATGTASTPTSTPCPPANSKDSTAKPANSTGSGSASQPGCTQDNGKESSSKKKKGIKKIIPWSGNGL